MNDQPGGLLYRLRLDFSIIYFFESCSKRVIIRNYFDVCDSKLRYLAVVFPVTSKVLRTKFNTQVALSVVWGLSLLLSSPALFLHGLVESKTADNQVKASSNKV